MSDANADLADKILFGITMLRGAETLLREMAVEMQAEDEGIRDGLNMAAFILDDLAESAHERVLSLCGMVDWER